MQTSYNSLTAPHLARLKSSLARWHASRDALMYGSQLGQLVGEVMRPLTIKSCGGLKTVVERDLQGLVVAVPGLASSDLRYRILVAPDASSSEAPPGDSSDDEREISGVELWRLFANPRLTSQLAASSAGEIVVAPAHRPLSTGKNPLRKLTSEDYRLLAGQFAATWDDDAARERMQASLQQPEFYNGWIEALRKSRTAELNPLRQWEITRAEHVARTLGEQLLTAGVDAARAAEIVANARPSSTPRVSRIAAARPLPIEALATPLNPTFPVSQSATEDVQWMRVMLHLAIDKMALSELREIRVPAGLLLEISRQRRA